MPASSPFKWRHFHAEIILLNVRWYLSYSLSYRDLAEMMVERGVAVDHTTIYRWVQAYSPELDQRCRRYLKPSNDSWRVDETYIKSKRATNISIEQALRLIISMVCKAWLYPLCFCDSSQIQEPSKPDHVRLFVQKMSD